MTDRLLRDPGDIYNEAAIVLCWGGSGLRLSGDVLSLSQSLMKQQPFSLIFTPVMVHFTHQLGQAFVSVIQSNFNLGVAVKVFL